MLYFPIVEVMIANTYYKCDKQQIMFIKSGSFRCAGALRLLLQNGEPVKTVVFINLKNFIHHADRKIHFTAIFRGY